ncbi:MAG: hypothetical protein LQ340_002342 [Diploschistes diacapsis]|nr:MAG: hypothetical protein LQ340_002342 [Diploschistes diacapsis]
MAGGNTATTAAGGGTTTAGQSTSTTATAQSVGGSGAGSSSASGGVGASSTSSTSSTSNTSSTSSTSSTSGTSSTGTGGASSSSAGAGSGTGSATATTGATASTVSALPCPCPSENGQTYTDSNNISYQIECDTEILYTDEPGSYFAPSLEDCLESCDAYVPATGAGDSGNQPCVGVRYAGNAPAGNNCFRMQPGYTTQATNPIDGICAAILVNTTAMSRKFAEADTPKLS